MEENDGLDTKKKERLELVLNFFFYFFLTIFVIISVALVLLNFFGFILLNVETGSMQPELPVNSLVFVQKIEPEKIEQGDIITFVMNKDGVLATHRVKEINKSSRTFTTKGDANNTDDPPVLWDNVVGVVRFKIPGIGAVFGAVTSAGNRPFVIAVIACLVAGMFARDFVKKYRKKKKSADSGEGSGSPFDDEQPSDEQSDDKQSDDEHSDDKQSDDEQSDASESS